jgi:ABC-2 type transport system permease protein
MSALVAGFGLYLRYVAVSIRTQLQYPASFAMATFGHFLGTTVEFLGVLALFDRFGALSGWTLAEVAFFYGLADLTFAIADALGVGFATFGTLVKSGDFDRVLLRPRSAALQLLGSELTLKRIGRATQALAVLAWASHAGDVSWSPAAVLLALVAIAGGVCLFLGLVVLQATAAFWTTETVEVWSAFTHGGNAAAQYPLPIFRPWFRRFFTYVVPLACVQYWPALAIMGRPDPLGAPPWLGWISPAAGVLFLLVALVVWRAGIRRYVSTGS